MRFATKPHTMGWSRTTTGDFPQREATSQTVSRVASEVSVVMTISAKRITWGGEAQCQPITREGRSVAAANAAIDHISDWLSGTPEGNWVSMAVRSDGRYGVDQGLISSFPVTCNDGDWSIVPDLEIDEFSRARIDASVDELVTERDTVASLGLI